MLINIFENENSSTSAYGIASLELIISPPRDNLVLK